jgi:hypothetical protein
MSLFTESGKPWDDSALRVIAARRLAARSQPVDSGCVEWVGYRNTFGYGHLTLCVSGVRRTFKAHRLAYELEVGPIPEGLVLDHLCSNPACVNPAHLEPVTQKENVRRGANARKTHCKHGHELSGANVYWSRQGWRSCQTCKAASRRRSRA